MRIEIFPSLGLMLFTLVWMFIGFMYAWIGIRIIGFPDMTHPGSKYDRHGGKPIPLYVYVISLFVWPAMLGVHILFIVADIVSKILRIEV